MPAAARDRIAFAADLELGPAVALYSAIAEHVGVAKVGLSLFVEHGPRAVEAFLKVGAKVFLDLKLHDIPNTVELAATRAAALGVSYLTIHASGGVDMVRAAMAGVNSGAAKAGHPVPTVLAVTVLTSMNAQALGQVGVGDSPERQVERLAALAVRDGGATGLVCSAREVAAVRQVVGPKVVLCTPGIRPTGSALNDQARVETPEAAIRAGAQVLVIGRPISAAADPTSAARAIWAEVDRAVTN